MSLANEKGEAWGWRAIPAENGTVKAITVSDVERLHENAELFIIKVDIEGGEISLMESNTDWAHNVPLIVFEMHDCMLNWQGTGHSFFSVLSQSKMDYLQHGENTFAFSHLLLSRFAD